MTNSKPISVLLIEDGDAGFIQTMLPTDLYCVSTISSSQLSAQFLLGKKFDVAILDLSPEPDKELVTFRALDELAPQIPIITISDIRDEHLVLEANSLGAQACLLRSELSKKGLIRAITNAIARKLNSENKLQKALEKQLSSVTDDITADVRIPLTQANRVLEALASSEFGQISEEQKKVVLKLRDANTEMLNKLKKLLKQD